MFHTHLGVYFPTRLDKLKIPLHLLQYLVVALAAALAAELAASLAAALQNAHTDPHRDPHPALHLDPHADPHPAPPRPTGYSDSRRQRKMRKLNLAPLESKE